MPQLIPFFYTSQIFWGYLVLLLMIRLSYKVILPKVLATRIVRSYILRI